MDWEPDERERMESATLGWVALYASMLAVAANVLCVLPFVTPALSTPLTALAVGCAWVGRRRSQPGSDQRQLSSIALGVSVVNVLLLFVVGLLQLYLFGMTVAMAFLR